MEHLKLNGFTLLEVMIALVILSVGILGMAGLQAVALQSSNAAYMRTVASNQINDMAERIRSNQQGFTNSEYIGLSHHKNINSCSKARCSSQEIAIRDFTQWNTENALRLPSGSGAIHLFAGKLILTISWDQNHIGAVAMNNGQVNCDPNTGPAFKCLSISIEP